jgi:hypothetical protein
VKSSLSHQGWKSWGLNSDICNCGIGMLSRSVNHLNLLPCLQRIQGNTQKEYSGERMQIILVKNGLEFIQEIQQYLPHCSPYLFRLTHLPEVCRCLLSCKAGSTSHTRPPRDICFNSKVWGSKILLIIFSKRLLEREEGWLPHSSI